MNQPIPLAHRLAAASPSGGIPLARRGSLGRRTARRRTASPRTAAAAQQHRGGCRRTNLQWELHRMPSARRAGHSRGVSESGGIARDARRSERPSLVGDQGAAAAFDAGGKISNGHAAVRLDEGPRCGRSIQLSAFEFRKFGAPGRAASWPRRSADWRIANERRAHAQDRPGDGHSSHGGALPGGRLSRARSRRLPSGWVVMGERQVFPGYCLLLPDPVVDHLNALRSDRLGAILGRYGSGWGRR